MDYQNDKRVVMTLDAGGTNFVFSAMQSGKTITEAYHLPTISDDLDGCLNQLVAGFSHVKSQCPEAPAAISFAFPGPSDYTHGVIGDLPNFPAFRGGIALGAYLEEKFGIPTFINNDGALFAYGEAMAGALPWVNEKLREHKAGKVYHNLLGVTLGTGFGGGVVIDGKLLLGDNDNGGNVWCFRNKLYPEQVSEEGVAIRAVQRVYRENSGDNRDLTPKDISDIARGKAQGDKAAALRSFAEMGEVAGDTMAMANDIADGIIVVGGGLARSADLILPALVKELNGTLKLRGTIDAARMPEKAYNLEDAEDAKKFFAETVATVKVPGSDKTVPYDVNRHTGVLVSKLGTSEAISYGAYAFALSALK